MFSEARSRVGCDTVMVFAVVAHLSLSLSHLSCTCRFSALFFLSRLVALSLSLSRLSLLYSLFITSVLDLSDEECSDAAAFLRAIQNVCMHSHMPLTHCFTFTHSLPLYITLSLT